MSTHAGILAGLRPPCALPDPEIPKCGNRTERVKAVELAHLLSGALQWTALTCAAKSSPFEVACLPKACVASDIAVADADHLAGEGLGAGGGAGPQERGNGKALHQRMIRLK